MKKINLLLKLFSACCLMLLSRQGMAQSAYKKQAEIKDIESTGFYQVTLSPLIISQCKADLSDVRIIDQAGKTVPYVTQKDLPLKSMHTFIEFPVSNVFAGGPQAFVTIYNQNSTSVKNLCLQIKNNDVARSISIKGSDDNAKWYAISENIMLNGSTGDEGFYEQCIPIPLSNYKYLMISVNGKNKTPLNILKAGIYTDDQFSGKYQVLPIPIITQKDSAKVSSVLLKFGQYYSIDKLHINVSGPKYYRREISFFTPQGASMNLPDKGMGILMSDTFDSNKNGDFFPGVQTSKLLLTIQNEDNLPLKIISATAYQLNQSLLSYLEAHKKYRIIFGDSTAVKPDYDLRFFTDSVGKNLKIAQLGAITLNTDHKHTAPQKHDFNFTYLMWGAIALILLALAFFTYKMANEVKTRNS